MIKLVVEEDAFGLKLKNHSVSGAVFNSITANANQWADRDDAGKMQAFKQWLASQVDNEVLQNSTLDNDKWLAAYIDDAFQRGRSRGFDDVKKQARQFQNNNFYNGTKQEFLRSAFGGPAGPERVKALLSRSFSDLKGVTDAMASQMQRTLADGLIQGISPREIARQLADRLDKIGKTRALTIARTEIIRAHAEGQLESMDALGVEKVGIMAEWSTAGDDLVCPLCSPLEAMSLKIKEARGMIPRHPNCR
jgi:SPP1 gp7 family putative phage head morphogenesis protein